MALVVNKRSVMTLFSDPRSAYSHRARIVLAEKNITVEIEDATPGNLPEDLVDLNPYGSLPTLVDRDLVLYESRIIMEYLDERFPHPPLLPVDPVSRAESRLYMHRFDNEWYALMDTILKGNKSAAKARKELAEAITLLAPVFESKPYFLSDELTLVDCSLAALLWRLPMLKVDLPKQAKPSLDYAERLFARESFQASLTESEQEMRA